MANRYFLTFFVNIAIIFAATKYNMKKILSLLLIAMTPALANAQNNDQEVDRKSTVEKPSRDFVMLKITNSAWADEKDAVNTKGIGRGFAAAIMYDFPIQKSNFSFAIGLGINAQNVYLDNQSFNFKDTGSKVLIASTADLKRYKYTTTRLEMPLELRFFANNKNRNTGFKAAIGANVGLMLGAHTKAVSGSGGSKIMEKVNTKRFTEQWNFAPTMRIGYGNFSLYGSYSLTPLFKEDAGPVLYPFSLGICITGL
jgi:hypothetical protein